MVKKIAYFFKELFKNDVGEYNPNAKKLSIGWGIYLIVGLIFSILIPFCFLWLESGQFTWDIIAIIWAENTNYVYRLGYFGCSIFSNIIFILWGFFTTYRINGNREMLSYKILMRFICILGYILSLICFIFSCVLY